MPVLLLLSLLLILVLLLTKIIACRLIIEVPSCRRTPLSGVIRSPLSLLTLNCRPFRPKQYAQRTVFCSEYNMLVGNLTIPRIVFHTHIHVRAGALEH